MYDIIFYFSKYFLIFFGKKIKNDHNNQYISMLKNKFFF